MDRFVTAKLGIKIITPVSISNGTILNAKDYLYDSKNGNIYFLNQDAWHNFIMKKGLFNSYIDFMGGDNEGSTSKKSRYNTERSIGGKSSASFNSLFAWLQKNGHGIDEIKDIVRCTAKADPNIKATLHDIIAQMKTVSGDVLIPGSSIKGVFRTAILYKLLQKDKNLRECYWEKIFMNGKLKSCQKNSNVQFKKRDNENSENRESNSILNHAIKELEKNLLHKLCLRDKAGKKVRKEEVTCSVMRGLLVSDAVFTSKATRVLPQIDLSFNKGKLEERRLPVYRECILPGTEGFIYIKMDKSVMGIIGINSIDDLLQCVEEFYNFIDGIYEEKFKPCYSQLASGVNAGNMYLGGRVGFLSKTLLAALAPNQEQAREAISQLLHEQFKKHSHLRDKHISPRTLKITEMGGKEMLQGIVHMHKL